MDPTSEMDCTKKTCSNFMTGCMPNNFFAPCMLKRMKIVPGPFRFSDVVSTSDDGDPRYGMMTTVMGGPGEDAAYEMEDADDIVLDGHGHGGGLVGPIGPIGPHPHGMPHPLVTLPLPPPRGMPPMAPPGRPMPPHPALLQLHHRRFSNGAYYDALPPLQRELEHHPPPPHLMGRLRGHPAFSSAASDTSSAAGFTRQPPPMASTSTERP